MATLAHRSRVHEHSILLTTSIVLALCTITILGLAEKFKTLNQHLYDTPTEAPLAMRLAWLSFALVPAYVAAAVTVKLKWPERVPAAAVAVGFAALGMGWAIWMFVAGLAPHAAL